MKKHATRDPISRAFRQDFPEFVERATALGVSISLSPGKRDGRSRVYWLDGYRQLTGYTLRSDGRPFAHEDAVANIDKVLGEAEKDRRRIAAMTVAERFARVVGQFRQMTPRSRMIGEVRFEGGDGGHCFFNAEFVGGVRLHEVGEVARAKAEWRRDEQETERMARFCDLLEADFSARTSEAAA